MTTHYEKLNRIDSGQNWTEVARLSVFTDNTKAVIKIHGKQIALFQQNGKIFACDNRCPHEGYPLTEGSVSQDCLLTCNWHNWKFDLNTGANLFGGDKLRIYPASIDDGRILLDLSDPPYETRYNEIINNLEDAFEDNEYDRIAREIARLKKLKADPLDALRNAIHWSYNKMKFGFTHAYAGMADWLTLRQQFSDNHEIGLVCLLEPFSHTAFDVLREPLYPYTENRMTYNAINLIDAIESEDENQAIAMVAQGIKQGLNFNDFEEPLTIAALAHYSDFGHSIIYITKTKELINKLGQQVEQYLLFALIRALIFATREEQIPEFRYYADTLKCWGEGTDTAPVYLAWHKKGIKSALKITLDYSNCPPEEIYTELITACAISMLSYNIEQQQKTQVSVSGNINWLDFTHALTFANAVRKQCRKFPNLWPRGLLQMACFVGRNAAFTTKTYDLQRWSFDNFDDGINQLTKKVIDHGHDEHIVSVHGLKTLMSVKEESEYLRKNNKLLHADILLASLNRFLNSPLKRRQTLRTAHQSLNFVAKES